jgi:hypothetical protein
LIYLDTSVAIAHLLAEDRTPREQLWSHTLVSSRLLEYELWTRLNARGLARSHADVTQALTGRVAFLELISEVLVRARAPFASPVRTLDALHLASLDFLREQGLDVSLASYDERMLTAARRLKISTFPLD